MPQSFCVVKARSVILKLLLAMWSYQWSALSVRGYHTILGTTLAPTEHCLNDSQCEYCWWPCPSLYDQRITHHDNNFNCTQMVDTVTRSQSYKALLGGGGTGVVCRQICNCMVLWGQYRPKSQKERFQNFSKSMPWTILRAKVGRTQQVVPNEVASEYFCP